MGYSCTTAASRTEQLWVEACVLNGGFESQNTWSDLGRTYFFERGRENADGAITGAIYKFVGSSNSIVTGTARKVGTYRIEPDGTVTRAPRFLKSASKARDKYIRETPGAREEALRTGG